MNTPEISKFLKALDNVKKDFTCGVCSKLCEDPVTLSVCFHMICSKHDVVKLKKCPTCNVSLQNCKVFVDESLKSTLPATKALDDMFRSFRIDKENLATTSKTATATSDKTKKRRLIKNTDIGDVLQKIPSQSTNKESDNESNTPNESKKRNLKKRNSIDTDSANDLNNSSLLKSNRNLEKRNNKGETALHVACRLGKISKVTELLNQGANANNKDNAGWTPLHEAVQNGEMELVQLLLKHNALINVPGQGNETPLHEAIRYNHVEIAEELVKNGADINIRNIKGETPMDLAKGTMKEAIERAADNVIQTQTLNITHISERQASVDFDDIRVYCVSQYRTVLGKLKTLVKQHSNLNIEAKLTKKVTHVIVDTDEHFICASTVDVLQGIVYGQWILSTDWINKSSSDKLEQFDLYEVKGVGSKTYTGPKRSRFNKYRQLPGILNGCHFYLHNFPLKCEITKQLVLTKAIMSKLITDAGGVVLRRVPNPESIPDAEKLVPYHAKKDGKLVNCSHYIIFQDMYEPMYNMSHLKALPIGWLIECLEKYELCEPW